jgi:hypothetical protein
MLLSFILLLVAAAFGSLILAFRWHLSDAAIKRRDDQRKIMPQYRHW